MIICYSLFLYIVIDLGFGSFVQNKITTFIKSKRMSGYFLLYLDYFKIIIPGLALQPYYLGIPNYRNK